MAKQLIPEELDALIQQFLTDGVLTDKERQVILKKAEGLGLDRDEIDLYLDAEIQKVDQATDAAARRQKGKQCPYCGGSVPQLTDKCPHCGENITAEASSELQEIFDNLEEALVDLKSGKDIAKSKATVERYARKAKMYYGSNPKIQKLLLEVENEMIGAEKKATSAARKNTFINIIANKWIWCIIEIIIVILAYNHLESKKSEYYQIYQEAEGRSRTAEWHDFTSTRDNQTLLVIAGIIVIGGTIALAVKDSKKK
jgi:hypothetical protein